MVTRSVLLLTLGFCSIISPRRAIAAEPDAQFTIQPDPIGQQLVGFGVQLNPYLYCTPNWGAVNESNVADLESKVIDLAPQHVRIFVLLQWFIGEKDPISKGDPRTRESFLRTVRLAQRAGATINLTLWYGPFPEPEKSARQFAAVLQNLIREQKLTAIKFITIQNEVNGDEGKFPMDRYDRFYRALDSALRELHLRNQLKIIGGDLVYMHQEDWFNNMAQHLSDVLDGYSVHIYWNYWDTARMLQRICEVPPIVATLPAVDRKPLYITEFGVRGHRKPDEPPGNDDAGHVITDTTMGAAQVGWFMMEAMNRGYVATVQWDAYDGVYDKTMHFGVIGPVTTGWPLRPGYHLLRLITHTIRPGAEPMQITGAYDGLCVSAMRGERGQWTILTMNYGEQPRRLTINGLPPEVNTLHHWTWNADGSGTTAQRGEDHADSCSLHATLPPLSLIDWTTRN